MATGGRVQIKPAGWAVILLALGAIGYGAWQVAAPHLRDFATPPPTVIPPDAGTPDDAGPVFDAGAPDAGLADAGRPDAGTPEAIDAGLAELTDGGPLLPPPTIAAVRTLPALSLPPAMIAGSEGAALHLVATEQVQDAVVSVAALAAHPEAVAFGVRAVWLAGETNNELTLLPSCDVAQLRAARLGVVSGSLSHAHLLSLVGNGSPPPIMQFDSAAALEAAWAEGTINGGEAPPSRRHSVPSNCLDGVERADALVVVHKLGKPLTMADVTATALLKGPSPSPEQVAAFFGKDGTNTFATSFDRASRLWKEASVIPAVLPASEAVDRRLLEQARPKPQPITGNGTPEPTSVFGFPSWVDEPPSLVAPPVAPDAGASP